MKTLAVKVGDTARKITDTLTQGGAALNLTGGSVVLVFKHARTGVKTRRTAAIVSAAAGTVEYQLVAGDVVAPAEFWIEWEVTLAAGVVSIPEPDIPTDPSPQNKAHRLIVYADLDY